MANRVGVNINANDLTRSGLRSVRNSVRRMQRQLPNSHRIYVNLNDDATRAGIRRVQRAVRGLPDNVFVNVRLNEPSRADRNRIRNSINNAVRGPGRSLGGFFSGLLEDGIGQGIINGFKKGGPVGAAFLGTILTSLLAVIAVPELLFSAQQIYNVNYQVTALLIVASLWYLAMTSVATTGQYFLERHYARKG